MNVEHLMYVILPIILGFVGDRYKKMKTASYACIAVLTLFLYYLTSVMLDGADFSPNKFEFAIFTSLILFSTIVFHCRKKYHFI